MADPTPSTAAKGGAMQMQVSPRPSFVALVPQYFVAFIALLYASGFLVVMAFLDRYGIRESGAEFWRARYIHIGILALALPVIMNATVFALWYVTKHPRADLNERQMRQRILPVMVLLINLEIVCFIMIMLTRGGQPGTPALGLQALQWILGVILGGLLGVLLIDRVFVRFLNHISKPEKLDTALARAHFFNSVLRWGLVPIAIGLDVWFALQFAAHLGGVSLWLVSLYLAFSIVLGLLIGTTVLYERRPTARGNIVAYRAMMICIILPLFYLMLLAFSYGVFPLIPAPRGGGDYADSPHIVIHLDTDVQLTTGLIAYIDPANARQTKPLILLQETSDGLYVADPDEAGGPTTWRSVGGDKPRLLFVNRHSIIGIEFESRSQAAGSP